MSETPKKIDNYQFIIVLFSSCEEPSIRKVKLFYTSRKMRHSSGAFRDTMSYNSCCSLSICKITDFLRCVFGVW